MHFIILPILVAHSLFSLAVLAGILFRQALPYSFWILDFGTLCLLILGAMLATPLLVFMIVVFRPSGRGGKWAQLWYDMRYKARRRLKRFMVILSFAFLLGGFMIATREFIPSKPQYLEVISLCLMGGTVALFFVAAPWIAFYSTWFEVDPS